MTLGPQTLVGSTRFHRRKRQPWTCESCGAAVFDPQRHAAWHVADKLERMPPPDPSEPECRGGRETLTVHIGEDGWPLR